MPCEYLRYPCISSMIFLLGSSDYCVWKREYFPTFNLCSGYLPLWWILSSSRHCSSWLHVLFLTLSAWWVCSWVLQGPPCKLVTIKCMWHYSRDGEKDESKTWCSCLRKCKWLFESCSHGARCHFMSHHQQHSPVFHMGHPLISPEDISELKSLGSVEEDLGKDKPEDPIRWLKSHLYNHQCLQERVVWLWKGDNVKHCQPRLDLTKSISVSSLFYHTKPATFTGFRECAAALHWKLWQFF